MELEWDEAKRRLNLIKHGIDFKDLHETFGLPMSITSDTRQDYREDRWIGIGLLRQSLIIIVFTERDQGPVRIISARKLRKNEEEKFTKRKN